MLLLEVDDRPVEFGNACQSHTFALVEIDVDAVRVDNDILLGHLEGVWIHRILDHELCQDL